MDKHDTLDVQVFLSGTFRELVKHRTAVYEAIRDVDLRADGMEKYPSRSISVLDSSLDMADRADLYLGVFSHRYGKYTEQEYHRAYERNIPILIFVPGSAQPLNDQDIEIDPDAQARMKDFMALVNTRHTLGTYDSVADLKYQIVVALTRELRRILLSRLSQQSVWPGRTVPPLLPPTPLPSAEQSATLRATGEADRTVGLITPVKGQVANTVGISPTVADVIAQAAITAEFTRLSLLGHHVAFVTTIQSSRGSGQLDIHVALLENAGSFVAYTQAVDKDGPWLSKQILTTWLQSPSFVVPLWWNESLRTAYWLDWPRYLIRSRGIKGLQQGRVGHADEFHQFDTRNPDSISDFFRWARAISEVWPVIHRQVNHSWLLDPILPITLLDVIQDPSIFAFLPVSGGLKSTLDKYAGYHDFDTANSVTHLFRAGGIALTSPRRAANCLADVYHIPKSDRSTRGELADQMSKWVQGIATDRRSQMADTLRAFDRLTALLTYRESGDLILPTFTYASARPLSNVVGLLPYENIVEPLLTVLRSSHDPQTLIHVLYCIGALNLPARQDMWKPLGQLRNWTRRNRESFGSMWRTIDREYLYIEAQLGSDEAITEYLTLLKDKDATNYEIPWNLRYYRGDSDLVVRTLEEKIEDSRRPDHFLRPVWAKIRDELVRQRARAPGALGEFDPDSWPVD